MPYEHSHHAMPSQYISQLAPHALKYSLRSCSEQYNNETALLYSDHKYKQYTVHDCLLPELHLLFILIIKRFHDSTSHVQGELFSVQAAHASALHILGWEGPALDYPLGSAASQMRRGLHQEESIRSTTMGGIQQTLTSKPPITLGSMAFSLMGWG